jgi:hypothetical protein
MQITPRTFLVSVAATTVLSASIGALAAAATSSQANPQAVAAAVQKVSDSTVQRELRLVDLDLKAIDDGVGIVQANQASLQTTTSTIEKNSYSICWDAASLAQRPSCTP